MVRSPSLGVFDIVRDSGSKASTGLARGDAILAGSPCVLSCGSIDVTNDKRKSGIKIAIDAMGGDHGVGTAVPGAELALERRPDTSFLLFGFRDEIEGALASTPRLRARAEVVHCDVAVPMDAKPSLALRTGRRVSSMWRMLQAVADGDADVAVSAGNTGALMAMSKFCLKTMAGVERPAIAAIWPTVRGESVVLDVGATVGADARQLVAFAILGSAMARVVLDVERPTLGLLNIGVEEIKGVEDVRAAARLLRANDFPMFDYRGFVEGSDIGIGTVDVVVTEGFAGNIALKTAEGTARQLAAYLRGAMSRTWISRLGYILARDAFDRLREKMDPRNVNGGVFLGLNGIIIKSHGGTDAAGFASAVELGFEMAQAGLVENISTNLESFHQGAYRDSDPQTRLQGSQSDLAHSLTRLDATTGAGP